MRKLDQEEKQFLTVIINSYKSGNLPCLADLVDNYLVNKDIQIDFVQRTTEVHFDQHIYLNNNNLPDEARQISWTLMKLVNLLKYLQDQNFLYLWKEANNNSVERYGQLVVNNPKIPYNINDKHIAELLVDYSFRTIVLGQTLVDYVQNNYQTTEDLQFNKNIKIANDSLETARQSIVQSNDSLIISRDSLKTSKDSLEEARKSVSKATSAIYVSVFMTLVSIGVSTYLVNYQTEQPISIDSKQIDQVLNNIKEIENKIKLPDTLKTIVTKPIKIDTKK